MLISNQAKWDVVSIGVGEFEEETSYSWWA
jgi:hypothetical protein